MPTSAQSIDYLAIARAAARRGAGHAAAGPRRRSSAGPSAGHRLARGARPGRCAGAARAARRRAARDVLRPRSRPGAAGLLLRRRRPHPGLPGAGARRRGGRACCSRWTPCGDGGIPPGEYCFLLLASVSGALTLAASRDLLTLVVSLEVVSLPAFALVALRRYDGRASEAALKLFLVSVVSTAVMLFGLSLVYGVTGAGAPGPDRHRAGRPRRPRAAAAARRRARPGRVRRSRWPPCRSTSGRRTPTRARRCPVAAYLSVVSKAAGFVGLALLLTRGLRAVRRRVGPDAGGGGRGHHDRRQPGRAAAAAGRPAAGLVVGRPVGLHAGAARARRRSATSTTCCRRPSPTCWPTA